MKTPREFIREGLERVARESGFKLEELLAKGRRSALHCAARQKCYRYMRENYGWANTRIAAYFKRDVSTVWAALASEEDRAVRNARCRAYWRGRVFGHDGTVAAYRSGNTAGGAS